MVPVTIITKGSFLSVEAGWSRRLAVMSVEYRCPSLRSANGNMNGRLKAGPTFRLRWILPWGRFFVRGA